MLTLGILSSHTGSNTRAVIDACLDGRLDAKPAVVISNNAKSAVLELARQLTSPAERPYGAERGSHYQGQRGPHISKVGLDE